MKASLILSLAGHSLFVIGFVHIPDYILAFTGGTEMSSSFMLFRGLVSVSMSVSHTNSGRTISVSPLVLAMAYPD